MKNIQRLLVSAISVAVAVNAHLDHHHHQKQMFSVHQKSNDDGLKEFAVDLSLEQPF